MVTSHKTWSNGKCKRVGLCVADGNTAYGQTYKEEYVRDLESFWDCGASKKAEKMSSGQMRAAC